MYNYRLLEWDTRFFGYKIALLEPYDLSLDKLKEIISELKNDAIKLAYCFAGQEDMASNYSLNQLPALLVDEKITYSKTVDAHNLNSVATNVKPYRLSFATDKLKSLTLQSGGFSRFNIDPNFRDNEFEKLYIEWIDRSVSRELADEIFVYDEGQEIQGFITLKIKQNGGSIGLIAVDERQRGKKIGKKLINAALMYFTEKKIDRIEVITQKANSGACRFYEVCGFKVQNIVNVYHLWIK